MSAIEATYVVLTDEEQWTPLAEVPASELLARWGPDATCCTLQGGFLFSVDGEPWNHEALDEIAMSTTWIEATLRLLEGQRSASVWAWEESGMTLVRRGDAVWAFDVHHSGHVICPLVKVDLAAFATALAQAAREPARRFAEVLASDDREVLKTNLGYAWRDRAEALEAGVQARRWTTAEPSGEAFPDVHLAIRLRDEAWLRRAAAEAPDAVFRGATPLGEAVSYRWPEGLRVLVEAGAEVNRPDSHGLTPLQRATNIWVTPDERADILLAAGAELDLHAALGLGRVRWILEHADQARRCPEVLCPWVARIKRRVAEGANEAAVLAVWGPVGDALIAGGAAVRKAKRGGPWNWQRRPLELAEEWKLPLVADWLRSRGG